MRTCRTRTVWVFCLTLVGILTAREAAAVASTVVTDAQSSVEVSRLLTDSNTVSGIVVNASPVPVHDVRLLVRRNWLWNNEFHPGSAGPGTSCFVTIPAQVPPQGTARFELPACPTAGSRADGRFQTSVEVVGFTEVLPSIAQR